MQELTDQKADIDLEAAELHKLWSEGSMTLRVENTLKDKTALLALTNKVQKMLLEFDQQFLVDARALR